MINDRKLSRFCHKTTSFTHFYNVEEAVFQTKDLNLNV